MFAFCALCCGFHSAVVLYCEFATARWYSLNVVEAQQVIGYEPVDSLEIQLHDNEIEIPAKQP